MTLYHRRGVMGNFNIHFFVKPRNSGNSSMANCSSFLPGVWDQQLLNTSLWSWKLCETWLSGLAVDFSDALNTRLSNSPNTLNRSHATAKLPPSLKFSNHLSPVGVFHVPVERLLISEQFNWPFTSCKEGQLAVWRTFEWSVGWEQLPFQPSNDNQL